jgi:predicted RNase H-like HicB family nuclease
MQYQIFVQNPAEQRFTASVLGFVPTCVAEGRTKDEALTALQQVVEERLANGEIVTVNWPQPKGEVPHAALLGNGMFKDDRAEQHFQSARKSGIRIGTMDLRIASICIVNNAILVTRNRKNFQQTIVPPWD